MLKTMAAFGTTNIHKIYILYTVYLPYIPDITPPTIYRGRFWIDGWTHPTTACSTRLGLARSHFSWDQGLGISWNPCWHSTNLFWGEPVQWNLNGFIFGFNGCKSLKAFVKSMPSNIWVTLRKRGRMWHGAFWRQGGPEALLCVVGAL